MDIIVRSGGVGPPLWDHFLLKDLRVKVQARNSAHQVTEEPATRSAKEFRWTITDTTIEFDLVIEAQYEFKEHKYPLVHVVQTFAIVRKEGIVITAKRWQKISPEAKLGMSKIHPELHPLLRFAPNERVVTLSLDFVDITTLFFDLHGDKPWFRTVELLKGTDRSIRVMALLRGDPLIWYVVVPKSVVKLSEQQPMVLYYPWDYGGIYYENNLAGLISPNHSTSVYLKDAAGDRLHMQSGAEVLFSFLTRPLTNEAYDDKFDTFVRLRERFKQRPGINPPPLHHYREILSYEAVNGTLVPQYWDPPFGIEGVIHEHKKILLIPQFGGAGVTTKSGLKDLIESALATIYTQGNHLVYDELKVAKPILVCFSQSGANVFTAVGNNAADIKAIVCVEPQYMNKKGEITSASLGRDVIPDLIKKGGKVVIIGRRKGNWAAKYLPDGVKPAQLILLPDDDKYAVFDYPSETPNYDPKASAVHLRRYSRLIANRKDPVIKGLLGGDFGDVDTDSAIAEALVEEIIEKYRSSGMNDEQIMKKVFIPAYNDDSRNGYFTHNVAIASGQEMRADGTGIRTFFDLALARIG